jgi:hypothetical protein
MHLLTRLLCLIIAIAIIFIILRQPQSVEKFDNTTGNLDATDDSANYISVNDPNRIITGGSDTAARDSAVVNTSSAARGKTTSSSVEPADISGRSINEIIYGITPAFSSGSTKYDSSSVMSTAPSSISEAVIQLYFELLHRQPTSSELINATNQIEKGTITLEGLRRKIIDTDEYLRNTKLQSNELNPELTKVISDNELINYIANIYNQETGKLIPTAMQLPLRDIYIYIDYNDFAFRAMLRDQKYGTFEQDVMTTENVNKPQLIEIFLKYFTVTELVNTGIEIFGANPSDKIPYSINSKDPHNGMNLQNMNSSKTSGLFDKDAAAKALGNKGGAMLGDHSQYSMTQTSVKDYEYEKDELTKLPDGKIRVPVHKHDMVLIPEFAWSIPQERPQVCTTLGQKQLVQPVFTNSSLLLGTPIGEAAEETQVGSIMPKFDFKEYITVPN